jgi:hypothetical protein
MFCVDFNGCSKSGDNGNCSVYPVSGVITHNTGHRVCGFAPTKIKVAPVTKIRVGQQKQKKVGK